MDALCGIFCARERCKVENVSHHMYTMTVTRGRRCHLIKCAVYIAFGTISLTIFFVPYAYTCIIYITDLQLVLSKGMVIPKLKAAALHQHDDAV